MKRVILLVVLLVVLAGCESGEDYALELHRIVEVGPRYSPRPPEGMKWLVVEATLANLQGDPLVVELDDLWLIDAEDNRYPADPPDVVTVPPLVTAQLDTDSQFRGIARFAVPPDAEGVAFEWCPNDACERGEVE